MVVVTVTTTVVKVEWEHLEENENNMNQSISEEWEKLFEGHCICDKYASQEDIGCIIHGIDGIKAKKFIQSKISQALTAERKELREKLTGRSTRMA